MQSIIIGADTLNGESVPRLLLFIVVGFVFVLNESEAIRSAPVHVWYDVFNPVISFFFTYYCRALVGLRLGKRTHHKWLAMKIYSCFIANYFIQYSVDNIW